MNIGVDLGGTNIAAALVDDIDVIVKRISTHTDAHYGTGAVVKRLSGTIRMLIDNSLKMPESIGIGIPGTVNDMTGEVLFTPNLPISGVNIVRELQNEFCCPVYLGNDANCAALGEAVAGCAKGKKDAVFITLGTGIGGGIIIGGRLYTGLSGAAGELGHMIIDNNGRKCGCGRQGCWETYASATGLVRTAIDIIKTGPSRLLSELCDGNTENIDGRMIFDAYRKGDEVADVIVNTYIAHLAIGVTNLINIFQPEIFCIAGGISNAWDCIEAPLTTLVNAELFTRGQTHTPQTHIVKSALGDDAGIIGAANLSIVRKELIL